MLVIIIQCDKSLPSHLSLIYQSVKATQPSHPLSTVDHSNVSVW